MTGLIVVFIFFLSVLASIWVMARKEMLWCRIRAGTFAIVVSGESGPDEHGHSGGVVDVLHEIPGRLLVKPSDDAFDWHFVDGKEERGLLHLILGVQWVGPIRSLRVNKTKDSNVSKKFVYFSRDDEIIITEVKAFGGYSLDVTVTFQYFMIYPVRALLKVENSNVSAVQMIKGAVASVVGTNKPEYFIYGDASHKQEVVRAIEQLNEDMLKYLGVSVYNIRVMPIRMSVKSQELFELAETTRRENEALLQVAELNKKITVLNAEAERAAGLLKNDVDADRVERVVIPTGNAKDGALVRFAEAVENTKVHTLVAGSSAVPVVGIEK